MEDDEEEEEEVVVVLKVVILDPNVRSVLARTIILSRGKSAYVITGL